MSKVVGVLPRTTVRLFPCPYCGAEPLKKCVGKREKVRESNHQERVVFAEGALMLLRS